MWPNKWTHLKKPSLPHMSHSKFPSGLQGMPIETGITLLIMDKKTSLMYFLKTYKVCGRFDEFILNFSWMRGHKTKILFNKKFQDLLFTILLKEPKRSAATLCLNNVIPVSIAVPGFSSISSENPGSFWSLKPKQSI